MDTNNSGNSGAPMGGAPTPTPTPMSSGTDKNMLLSVLSYLGPLVIVSFMMGKDIPAVKFHVKQGAVLFAIEVIIWLLGMFMMPLWFILNLLNFATLILSIIGIVNVIQHKEKELPLVGSFSSYFKF